MRDTDKDWHIIGDELPYFGVLADPKFKDPDANNIQSFFQSGVEDVQGIFHSIKSRLGEFSPKSALDFGCGPGRLLIPLARLTGDAYGVDVSDGMLKLARAHIAETGVKAVVGDRFPERLFDWVNSWIVLQHIPPRRGYEIIKKLWALVDSGGVLSIQFTIYRDASHTGEILRDIDLYRYDGEEVYVLSQRDNLHPGSMSMYDYDLSRVLACMNLENGQSISLVKTDHAGCHGVVLYARKT